MWTHLGSDCRDGMYVVDEDGSSEGSTLITEGSSRDALEETVHGCSVDSVLKVLAL